ncbi:hypothetical protein NLJ89_g8970 [Agrocybe chaxingu]|uniref:Uncharacterized protein n=1 Tax=Agrocybe chaxingu TaxID=84603 RepID=A0A9W8JTX9_9AGAR|nr:hypothetical protein NLJ89_g8970 [Agrocybe chaxingu]
MEATFDNKANVLNAKVHASHDNSVLYVVNTKQTMWGRTLTELWDKNPLPGEVDTNTRVGAINWKQRKFEVDGTWKSIDDVRRRPAGLKNRVRQRSRFWKWADDHEEYSVVHLEDGWKATCTSTNAVEATFAVPYRPQIFGKAKPVVLNLGKGALSRDEVFLILVLIYSETKRQEKMNSAGGW